MGYRIESYTIDELQRVALPGTAATALFWAIPLGNWPGAALQNLWHEFTRGNGVCRRLGLLLAKDTHQVRDGALRKSNLSGLVDSGKLVDLLPKGAVRHAASVPGNSACGFLICSGAYPQPGWGVWIDINNMYHPESLDQHIEEVLTEIPRLDICLTQIEEAAKNWAKLEKTKIHKPQEQNKDASTEYVRKLLKDIIKVRSPLNIDNTISFLDRM